MLNNKIDNLPGFENWQMKIPELIAGDPYGVTTPGVYMYM